MPAFNESMTDDQVAELVSYLRRQFAPDQPEWRDVPDAVSRIRASPAQ
jgi:nicotinate dehydrogenase subunit B